MALGKDYVNQQCSMARALEVVGERWTLLVVRDALYGVRRYNDFLVHLGIPRAVLATRLQTLTEAGVLEKRLYQQAPPREEYVLTESGKALWPVVRALSSWGLDHLAGTLPMRLFVHAECGTEVDAYGVCPACSVPVPPEETEMRPGEGLDTETDNPVDRVFLTPRRLLRPIEADRV